MCRMKVKYMGNIYIFFLLIMLFVLLDFGILSGLFILFLEILVKENVVTYFFFLCFLLCFMCMYVYKYVCIFIYVWRIYRCGYIGMCVEVRNNF